MLRPHTSTLVGFLLKGYIELHGDLWASFWAFQHWTSVRWCEPVTLTVNMVSFILGQEDLFNQQEILSI